jgi:hypothetical protein
MTPEIARQEIAKAAGLFPLLDEPANLFQEWESLINKYLIIGKAAHDARLVATAIRHSIPRVLTFNDTDFSRYNEIKAINPFDVLGISRI